MLLLYNLALGLASFLLVPYYLLRGLWKGKYRGTLRQRLGWFKAPLNETGQAAVWLHAVSVGEVLSSLELVAVLRRRLPHAKILVSTTTATGQAMAREKLGRLADGFFYAPVDLASAVRRTLRHARPRLLIVAETEIWPNLFREAKRSGASLMLVNARISDRSAPRYQRLRFFFRRVLVLPDAILAQSPLDQQRLIEAGAPLESVEVGGNLKFDFRAASVKPPAEVAALLDRSKPRAVILAGSTRGGEGAEEAEEAQVVRAFRRVSQDYRNALLLIAPRHPERFDAVAELLAKSGFNFLRRSQLKPDTTLSLPGVLLLDSLGELASLYPLADAVFVGGSLVKWGGHNVLEPAFAGRPIVVGPHMQNFRAIAEELLAAGGMVQVQDAEGLGSVLLGWLRHPADAAGLGARARRLAESHRGAAERIAGRAEQLFHRAAPADLPRPAERLLLWLPSRLYEAGVRIRQRAYERGRLGRRRLDTPVISIGNITTGGTGKTPVVHWLLEQLEARHITCALLTRGYRRSDREPVTILAPGDQAAKEATGDEAQMILRRFRVPVGIATDRYRAGVEIEKHFHPDVFVLDDGFQHVKLARDLDIVLIDVTAPFGRGELLPLGRLREPLASLARADALLLTRAEPWERWEGLQEQLRRYNADAPIFFARFELAAWVDALTGAEQPVTALASACAVAFCGVGNPDSFWRAVENTGLNTSRRLRYRDHHRYSAADVRDILEVTRRANATALVTTEKDVINLPEDHESWPLPIYWLKTRVVVDRADELLDLILRRCRLHARERALG